MGISPVKLRNFDAFVKQDLHPETSARIYREEAGKCYNKAMYLLARKDTDWIHKTPLHETPKYDGFNAALDRHLRIGMTHLSYDYAVQPNFWHATRPELDAYYGPQRILARKPP